MKFRNKNFNLNGNIVDFDIKDPITLKVKQFYEKYPFPNYKIDDNKHTILEKGNKNSFVAELKNFIGFNKLNLIQFDLYNSLFLVLIYLNTYA